MPKIITLFCPSCGANLDYNIDKPHRFCQYCGSEIKIGDDYNSSHTYRKIDESRIKEAETMERIRMKELELKERELLQIEKTRKLRIKSSIILAIIGFITSIPGSILVFACNNDTLVSIGGFLTTIGMGSLASVAFIWLSTIEKPK